MSKKTSYLLGILLTIIVGTFFYLKLCCSTGKIPEKKPNKVVVAPKPQKVVLAPFGIKEVNDQLLLKMEESFAFGKSEFNVTEDLSKDVNDGALKIKEYLDENGQKRFNIIGYYTSDEENTSAYPNLGLARANAVKGYMSSKGVSINLINTFGQLKDDLALDANNITYKPIDFGLVDQNFEAANKDEEALKLACEALKASPLILYFNTSQASIKLSDSQREKFAKIKNCVDKLGARIEVVGHTDSMGDADKNKVLGQNRADFAKAYLVTNGISASSIDATSKGQIDPIMSNTTAAGRSKNRRTVVTIK